MTTTATSQPFELPLFVDNPTVCAAFQAVVERRGDHVAFRTLADETMFTWQEYGAQVRSLAAGFAALGLRHGATIATHLTNRPEFHFVDMAATHLGAVPFGVYNSSSPAQVCERLDNADARFYVTEQKFLAVAREAVEKHGAIDHLVVVDADVDGALTLADVAAAADPDFDFDGTWRSVRPDDLITIIYTSGTTGPPKGVQWDHGSVMGMLRAFSEALPMPTKQVSALPLAHAGERLQSHYMPLGHGSTVTCCTDVRQVLSHVADCHPDFFITVPRLWAKIRLAFLAQIEDRDPDTRAALMETISLGTERLELEMAKEPVPTDLRERHETAKALFRSEILVGWGLDDLRWAFIGSAPPAEDVVVFFHAIGIPLLEAYGLTEATGFAGAWARPDDFKLGSGGKPLPGVELQLAADGEILLRSAMTMVGYRKDPEATAEAVDAEGWLHTGDIGVIDDDGFVKIVDRKKDIVINAWGKNMSPSNIENEVKKACIDIGQVAVAIDGRNYTAALITLDADGAQSFARRLGLADPSVAAVSREPAVIDEISEAIRAANGHLSKVEQVKKFKLLDVEWTPDSDELTPTMKIRRRNVMDKYQREVDAIYADDAYATEVPA